MSMTRIHDPVGARALAHLARPRAARPGLLTRLLAWHRRRREDALLRDLPRETARDIGLTDWRSHRSSAECGPLPQVDRT